MHSSLRLRNLEIGEQLDLFQFPELSKEIRIKLEVAWGIRERGSQPQSVRSLPDLPGGVGGDAGRAAGRS